MTGRLFPAGMEPPLRANPLLCWCRAIRALSRAHDIVFFPETTDHPRRGPDEGKVLVIENGQLRDTPFLDIKDRISGGTEQGLLGLAFHPKFPTDRRFFSTIPISTAPSMFLPFRYRILCR